MPVPWIFLLSFAWVYGDSWISQDHLSFTRRPNKTVHISCKLSGVPLQNTIVHWYQLREGEPIKRIFYGSAKTQKQDKLNTRLETDEKSDGTFYLIINNVIRADEATYYCACWDLTVSHHLREPVDRCWDWLGPWDSIWSEMSVRKLEPKKGKTMYEVSFQRNLQVTRCHTISQWISKETTSVYHDKTSACLSCLTRKFGEGSDFCRSCEHCDSSGWSKIFAEGTRLIVIPPDKNFDADISPKPTIFLPSVAETNLHKAGTYLCLLEKFFPDVIRVYWKEKDGDKILESQEGNTLKTNDTYMKFSWLTVTAESMHKEHRCIVKHENNKKGVDQEISFPPIEKVAMSAKPTRCWHENDGTNERTLPAMLQLQFTSTSAYYTYLLLLLKSAVHLAMVSFFLARRTAACGNEKKS